MNRETARQEIRNSWRTILQRTTSPAKQKVNGEVSYICPLCGHGTNGDGLTRNPKSKDGNSLKCFGCDFSGDIIDLFRKITNTDYNTALSLLAEEIGITIDENRPSERTKTPGTAQGNINTPATPENAEEEQIQASESKAAFTDYYENCKRHISDKEAQAYLRLRGISNEIAARYWLGYDEKTGFLIIPCSTSFYIARNIDRQSEFRYKNPAGVSVEIFNLKAVYNEAARPVYVVEGAIDALSILEAGGLAVALNSVSNTRKLIAELERRRTASTLILSLDNDDSGRNASAELAEGLRRLDIAFTTANICSGHKDPNEALTDNREAFIEAVQTTAKEIQYPGLLTTTRAKAILEAVDDHYLELPRFPQLAGTLKLRTHDTVVIAADTGAGKSSLSLNILHDLQDKYPALYVNLEMDAATVLQRLIAIHTGIELDRIEGYKHDANTRAKANEAIAEITARKEIQLIEDIYDLKQIEAQIQAATAGRSEPTIVFIDTGLLVTLPNKSASRYERFTQISEELRRISRLNNVIMFVLLQQNREGKKEDQKAPTNSSLKESGSWENDATKIMFLWNNPQTGKKELAITKNRSGKTGKITLDYSPQTQIYKESSDNKKEDKWATAIRI